MSEITNRAEALNASIEKWVDILERIEEIHTDIKRKCGFCVLAENKLIYNRMVSCRFCESDARKLCKEYVKKDGLIINPLREAYHEIHRLLTQLRSLPVDLKKGTV